MKSKSIRWKAAMAFGAVLTVITYQNCAPAFSDKSESQSAQLSRDIDQLSKALSSSSSEEQIESAEQRRKLLLQLAEQNPQKALSMAVSSLERSQMPPAVQDQLEQVLEVQGKIEKYYEDYADGRHKERHILRLKDERLYNITFAEKSFSEKKLQNQSVSVKGLHIPRHSESLSGDIVVGDASKDILMLAAGGTSEDGSSLAYDLPYTMGAQRTLVILVNFQDKPSEKPWTVSEADSLMFGSSGLSDYFKENSSQQTWLTGTVTGWYTLPIDSTVCDGFGIDRYAKSAAQAAGFTLSNYDRFVFAFPKNACGYAGMAQVGAFPSSTWINNNMNLHVVAHEVGHNLGLQHAHALDCGDTTLGSTCTSQTYGDTLNVMGYSGTIGHFNGFNKESLGWLSSSNIVTVSSSGSYSLQPTSVQTSALKVLRVAKGVDASGNPNYYYIEFRQPIGFDARLTERGVIDPINIFNGIIIRTASPTKMDSSYLLDMTAGSNFVDMKDAALTVGKSFSDPANGITITTLSVSGSGSSVYVGIGATSSPTPTPTPTSDTTLPNVSITSPASGATVSGIISVIASASDNVAVSKVEFYVDGILKLSDATVTYSMSLDTKTLVNGSHTLMAKAYDSSNNSRTAQISVNVSNSTSDTTAPVVSITSPGNGAVYSPRTAITIQASASDNVKISRVEFYVNGALICSDTTADYSCSYTLGGAKGASYMLEARAYDSSGNTKAHQINISSSGTGRKN